MDVPVNPAALSLVQRMADLREGVGDAGAHGAHRTDGGDGDQRGDQAVFDGGRGLVVANQLLEKLHVWSPDESLTLLRSEEHTSDLQSLMRISYAVFCLKKKHQPLPPLNYIQ